MMLMQKTKKPALGLLVGALGVVFGDIGTSPLYVVKVLFGAGGQHLAINPVTVYGTISLVLWTLTIVVSIKYVGFIMRADNHGEGGIMALVAQLKGFKQKNQFTVGLIFLGLIGIALFYGDSAITPAISVLSAVEGLKVVDASLAHLIVPMTLVILAWLFWIQQYGTALIGRLFGPVMLTWFVVIGFGGLHQVVLHPAVLQSLLPSSAVRFVHAMPVTAFVAMSAVVLAVTGAEALFADMGHFGRRPIARTWFFIVFPALILCYMGQGALLLGNNDLAANPFFFLFPHSLYVPVIILAALATLIASQAVISGAFSLTRQAIQLGFLPRLRIRHTSDVETGQIYVPFVNMLLLLAVAVFVIFFGSSVRLAGAYGIAVSGAIAVDTLLFFAVMRGRWRLPIEFVILAAALFVSVDAVLVTANVTKIAHGGWLPLAVAFIVLVIIDTWREGKAIIGRERRRTEGLLTDFVADLHNHKYGRIRRVPGHAVYVGHHQGFAPLALRTTIENLHELHHKVVILYVHIGEVAHVPENKRADVDDLGYDDGISQVVLHYGYHDIVDIPKALAQVRHLSPELDFDAQTAAYFISQTEVVASRACTMAPWRKSLFMTMQRSSQSSSDYYKLPLERTTEMRSLLEL